MIDYNKIYKKIFNDTMCGLININNDHIVCACKYQFICDFNGKYAKVAILGKIGVINEKGIEIIKCEHEYMDIHKVLEKYILNLNRIEKLKTLV